MEGGINWFDTGDTYGTGRLQGKSEILLGQFKTRFFQERRENTENQLRKKTKGNSFAESNNFLNFNQVFGLFSSMTSDHSSREKGQSQSRNNKEEKQPVINICTKLAPFPYRIGKESMVKAILASQKRINNNQLFLEQNELKRIETKSNDVSSSSGIEIPALSSPPIEMGQLHWAPPFQWQENAYWDGLCLAQEQGLIKEIGLSNYGPKRIKRAAAYFAAKGQREYGDPNRYKIKTLQVQFSLISRYPLTNGLVETCQDLNIKLIGYSPLGLGFLTKDMGEKSGKKLTKGPRSYLFNQLEKDYLPVKTILFSLAEKRDKSPAQIALQWVRAKGALPLVGVRTVKQAKEAIDCLSWKLSSEEVAQIDASYEQISRQTLQNIFQSD